MSPNNRWFSAGPVRSCAAVASVVSSAAALAADTKEDLSAYLAGIGPGKVAANEIIGLAGSAVSNVQTAKEKAKMALSKAGEATISVSTMSDRAVA